MNYDERQMAVGIAMVLIILGFLMSCITVYGMVVGSMPLVTGGGLLALVFFGLLK